MKITIKVEEQGKRGRWKLCQSCVNRTETVHGTLRFLYLSHLLYGIRENLHYESVYFKELHNEQEYY